jgi:hypothetical protein
MIPNNPALAPSTTNAITFEAWVRPFGSGTIASQYDNFNAGNSNFFIRRESNDFLTITGNGTNIIVSNSSLPYGLWSHVAVVFEHSIGQNKTKLYINGVLNRAGDLNYNSANGDRNLYLGHLTAGGATADYFSGMLDEVRFWQGERSEAEILANLTTELAGNEAGLLAYYPLNEGTPAQDNSAITNVLDQSGNNNHGTLPGFAKTGSFSNWVNGALINGKDSDGDGSGNNCDLCQGNDATGDSDMDGICDDMDPDCQGDAIIIPTTQYAFSNTIRASQSVTTGDNSVVVPAGINITYTAPQAITLGKNFSAEAGAVFEAIIADCSIPSFRNNNADSHLEGATKHTETKNLQIKYNPSTAQITMAFQLDTPSVASVEIYNKNGQKIAPPVNANWLDSGTYQLSLQTADYSPGVYIAVMQTSTGMISKRFALVE